MIRPSKVQELQNSTIDLNTSQFKGSTIVHLSEKQWAIVCYCGGFKFCDNIG